VTQTPAERRYIRLTAAINKKAAGLGREGRIRPSDLAAAFMNSNWVCTYCGIGIDPLHCSFDHVVPFDNGGPNEPGNIVACCMTCQRGKGTKSPPEYEFARHLLSQCEVCGVQFKPRYADWRRGFGRTCSRICSGKKGGQVSK
jgi:5-methylcytosine-specific restriction endonuclease McrA